MIPFFSIMVPLYYELKSLGLLGHLAGVILPAIAGAAEAGLPIGIGALMMSLPVVVLFLIFQRNFVRPSRRGR